MASLIQSPAAVSPSMAGTVCSMCGDVGFRTSSSAAHAAAPASSTRTPYCTNYYGDAAPAETGVCDWCLSDDVVGGKKRQYASSTSRCGAQQQQAAEGRSGEQQPFVRSSSGFGKGAGKVITGGVQEGGRRARRYKLLKDVLC
ncbi:hypothetical protein EJB05_20485, partial [Eragrostis curvula]